jgi:hypothetical protein
MKIKMVIEFEKSKISFIVLLLNLPKLNKSCSKCEYLTENPKFNSELPESSLNKPFFHCYSYGSKIVDTNNNNYGDEKGYCYFHKKIVVSNYKKQEKEKSSWVPQEETEEKEETFLLWV